MVRRPSCTGHLRRHSPLASVLEVPTPPARRSNFHSDGKGDRALRLSPFFFGAPIRGSWSPLIILTLHRAVKHRTDGTASQLGVNDVTAWRNHTQAYRHDFPTGTRFTRRRFQAPRPPARALDPGYRGGRPASGRNAPASTRSAKITVSTLEVPDLTLNLPPAGDRPLSCGSPLHPGHQVS